MRLPYRSILLVVLVCMGHASLASGASVTITSSGGGAFAVLGDNTKGIYGIELTIGYDTSLLATPTLKWGSLVLDADMHMANTTVPGSIRVAIIKAEPFTQNSGPIAALTFATQNSSCGITSVAAKIIDSASLHLPVQADIAAGVACAAASEPVLIPTPGVPFSQPATTAGVATSTTGTPATTTTTATTATTANTANTANTATVTSPQVLTGLGAITMPGDTPPRKEEKPADSKLVAPQEPAETAEAVTPQLRQSPPEKTAEESEPASIKQTVYGSVLGRFRTYQGEKTADIMIALFTMDVAASIHQIPPVIVSDGKASVRVSVDQSAIKGASTNFALNGAKLVSLKKEDDSGRWLLEILPHQNSLTASVTILNSSSMIEFPLTVVPPAATVSGKKADFTAFLKDSGAQAPKNDLNGDGRHDYLDDYIYTAHYLMRSGAAAK